MTIKSLGRVPRRIPISFCRDAINRVCTMSGGGRAIRYTPRSHSNLGFIFPFRFAAGCRWWLSVVEVIPRASALSGRVGVP